MRSMHPVLKRGGLYWDRELLPPAAFIDRFARLQAAIAASGDDAWILYGDVERYGAIAWFSNFLPRTRAGLALVPREGAPTLLLAVGLRDVPAAKTLTWVDDVRPYGNLPRVLIPLMAEKDLGAARIGLAGVEEMMPSMDWREITNALPGMQATSRTHQLDALRAQKDDCEIDAIRAVAGIVRAGLDHCASVIRPGRRMREVTAELDRHLRASAAEDVRIMIASGEQSGVSLRPTDDRILRSGDCVLIHVAAEAQRYWAESARTFVIGKASEGLRVHFARGQSAMDAMRATIRAKAIASDIANAGLRALNDDSYVASASGYGFGNGIGLDAEEFPRIEPDSGDILVDRSTLALRVIGHAGGQGAALAETLVLREGRLESLTGPPRLVECG